MSCSPMKSGGRRIVGNQGDVFKVHEVHGFQRSVLVTALVSLQQTFLNKGTESEKLLFLHVLY